MRSLLRLAIWGTSAAAGLAVVVLTAHSNAGSQRLMTAMAPAAGQPSTQQAGQSGAQQVVVRSAEAENEARRLADAVRTLSADRDRLLTRITSLERNLEDITGSIKRQATATPQSSSPPSSSGLAAGAPATTVAREPPPAVEAVAPAPPTRQPPPAATGSQESAAAANRVANVPAGDEASETERAKPEIGVDIGGAVNFDGLRLLWNSTRGANAALLEGMHPVVVARENIRTRAPELRLVVGPFPNSEAAVRLCSTLSAARRYCQLAAFQGEELSLAEPERRPAAAPQRPAAATPERRPAASPAPAPAPKATRPFP
jgi:hypothetical protein